LDVNLSYIRIIEDYLDKYGLENVAPGEDFFAELWDRMMEDGGYCGKAYSIHTRKKVARSGRKIINEYFFSRGITKRKVLLKVEMDRYKRFFSLTKQSQDAIKWFEDNGKMVKAITVYVNDGNKDISNGDTSNMVIKAIHSITNRQLLPTTISQKISTAMRVLDIVGKNGFEDVNSEDVDYKDANFLRRFINSYGKILSKKRTGSCSKHQRKLAIAIKRARVMAILPFVSK